VAPDAAAAPTVSVAAASDLRYAMDDLVATYQGAHPAQAVAVTYGSSGSFFAQISQGAPFDVFFSADIAYPEELAAADLAAPDTTRLYAKGRIVVWVQDASPIDVEDLGITAVLDPAAERVAIANPDHAPYGRAARAAMEAAGVWDQVQPRIVLGENVSQAAQFVESGAADLGILALSLAIAPPLCREGRYALVPQELHPPIDQGAVVLTGAADPTAAQAFLDFVLGPEGRIVLDRYGFLLPEA
jgi:molybdate transport system substrate-binding protein